MKASEVQMKAPSHIWEGRIPVGGLSLIVGPSSAGKSTLLMRLAADLTTGELTGDPGDLVMVMLEDSDTEVNVPRFLMSGGDLDRLHLPEPNTRWTFPEDAEKLRGLMKESGAKVAFIDPLTSVVPNLGNQVARHTLDELHRMAEADRTAIVFLHHFIKSTSAAKTVKEAIAGGHHVYNLARSIHVFGWEPNEGGRLVLAHEKMSGDALQKSLLFNRKLVPHPADREEPRRAEDLGEEAKYTALEVTHSGKLGAQAKGLADARQFIRGILLSEGGMGGDDLKGVAIEAGFSGSVFHHARSELRKHGLLTMEKSEHGTIWRVIPEEGEDDE